MPVSLVAFQECFRVLEVAGQQFHTRPDQMLRHVIGGLRELLKAWSISSMQCLICCWCNCSRSFRWPFLDL